MPIVLAISTVSAFAVRSLSDLAKAEALARVELAVTGARDTLRTWADDMQVAASLLAQRPTLTRLLESPEPLAIQDYLRRYCDSAELDVCLILAGTAVIATVGHAELQPLVSMSDETESGGQLIVLSGAEILAVGSSRVSGSNDEDALVIVARGITASVVSGKNDLNGLALSFAIPDADSPITGHFGDLDFNAVATGMPVSGSLGEKTGFGASIPLITPDGQTIAVLRAELPAADIMQPVREISMRILVTGLVVCVLATVSAVLIGRRWARGMARLTDSARNLGAGDLTTSVQPESGKELSVLSRTMEEMRQGLAELGAARRTRDAVLANISHEFRTPLAAQLASIELLRDSVDKGINADERELIASLERGAKRLARLIDNLLESVRIEAGQLGIRHQDVKLAAVVTDALDMIDPLIQQRHQSAQIDGLENLPPVLGDHQRLTQVFVNLLANASKFGRERGTIHIGGRIVGNDRIEIAVEDDGVGFADSDEEILFSPFRRSRGPDPEQSGLGLGLYIAKSIVERHRGCLMLTRTDHSTTRATVELRVGDEYENPGR